jgi:membrane protease YdiL (CAAX protease family)
MLLILLGVSYWLQPNDLMLTFSPGKWLLLLVTSLLLTPIQIAAEELFCRGYLMQGLGLLTRNRWVLVSVPSVLFALGHFSNPEMARGAVWMALQYWSLGVFLALLTLRDNRLELALGIHAAQNMFVLLLANTADSVLQTPSVWTLKDTGDPRLGLVCLLIQSGIFYWLIFGRRVRRSTMS